MYFNANLSEKSFFSRTGSFLYSGYFNHKIP